VGRSGTIEGRIEQGAQQNLRGNAAVGIGHDAARLSKVRTKHPCKSENHRQRYQGLKKAETRLPAAVTA
jgi:hypothetical protein